MKTSTLLLIAVFSGLLFYLAYTGFNELNSTAREVKHEALLKNNTELTVAAQPVQGSFIKTSDGVNLSYTFNKVSNDGIILLPQLGKDKSSYSNLEMYLNKNGITTLSIDFRGMGNTIYSKQLNDFTEQDFASMEKDVEVAVAYFKSNNIRLLGFVGASIGANLAFNFAVNNEIPKAVLLSPGLSYRGISIEGSMNKSFTNILLIASKEDSYSFVSSEKLAKSYEGSINFIKLKDKGHGTNMLDLDIINKIVEFFKKN